MISFRFAGYVFFTTNTLVSITIRLSYKCVIECYFLNVGLRYILRTGGYILRIGRYILRIWGNILRTRCNILRTYGYIFTPLFHMPFQIMFECKCSRTLLTLMRHDFFGNI